MRTHTTATDTDDSSAGELASRSLGRSMPGSEDPGSTAPTIHRELTARPRVGNAFSGRVILVCDDRRMAEQMRQGSSEIGCSFSAADNAESALRLLAQQPYDIAIVDLTLRSGAGSDLIGTMRQRWSWIQVILLGGFGEDDSTRHAIRSGVSEFLTKPCSQREIAASLSRAYRRRMHESGAVAAALNGTAAMIAAIPDTPASASAADERPSNPSAPALPAATAMSLGDVERLHILAALERNKGNRESTAAELGISVRKLYYRLQQYHRDGPSRTA